MIPDLAGLGQVLLGLVLGGPVLWGLALSGLVLGTGCAGEESANDPQVVATFTGGVVRREEFDVFKPPTQAQETQSGAAEAQDWREGSVKELALRKFLAAEARQDEKDPALQAAVKQARSGVLQSVMSHELGWDQIAVTPEEIRNQYDSHPEQYKDPDRLRLQYIFLRAEEGVLPEAEREKVRQQMEDIRREVMAGADFEEMARRHSQSSTAHAGGWLTLRAESDVHPSFKEAAFKLRKGEVSDVIETPTGFQIAKLIEILPALDRPFDKVVEFARRRAAADKLAAVQAAFVAEAGPRHGLALHYDRLSDPLIPVDEGLIDLGGEKFTFQDLCLALGEHQLSHLYAGCFPKVYEFLDDVVRGQLLVLEAERLGVPDRPAVARQIEDAVRDVMHEWALNKRLRRITAEVPESELREYFMQNEKRYQTLRTRDLDVFLLKPEEGEPLWKTLKRGEALVERIRAGEDFATLARSYSKHYSASNGGRMENLTNQDIVRLVGPRPWFSTIINNLKPGEVSDAVMAEVYDPGRMIYFDTGIIFVRLIKDVPPEQKTFEEAVDFIRSNYTRRNYQTLVEQVRREILGSMDLKIFFDRLPPI